MAGRAVVAVARRQGDGADALDLLGDVAVNIVGPVRRSRGIAHRRQAADAAAVRGVVVTVGRAPVAGGECSNNRRLKTV